MLTSKFQTVLSLVASSFCVLADVYQPQTEDQVKLLFEDHDYAVINFKDDGDESQIFENVFTDANEAFKERVASGLIEDRRVVWMQVDLDEYPELAYHDEHGHNQLVLGLEKATGMHRFLNYRVGNPDERGPDADFFADIITDLTGDWFSEVQCDDI